MRRSLVAALFSISKTESYAPALPGNKLLAGYLVSAGTLVEALTGVTAAGCCGRVERNHPAAIHERGIENSDQPHSRHTRTSGDGFIGG